MAATQIKRTAEQARTFEHASVNSYMTVALVLAARNAEQPEYAECRCEPYADVFTFNRWIPQGFAVRKGERAIRHQAWVETKPSGEEAEQINDRAQDTEEAGRRRILRPKTTFLFCRCQVAETKPRH